MKYNFEKKLFRKFYSLIIISLIIINFPSCGETIVEPAGLAEYFVKNESAKILIFKDGIAPVHISPSHTEKIGEDGDIGIEAPPPSEGLGLDFLKLYRDDNGNEIVAFEQKPVVDNQWTKEKQDNLEYGLVHFTLTITENMIN